MSNPLSSIEINPKKVPQLSIIWLHGLGASGEDFLPIVNELQLPKDLPVRFVFPHAPVRPVTINNGYVMPAWYDILGLSIHSAEDEPGIRLTEQAIRALIAKEIAAGIPAAKIILAGFSQGGAMALHTALRYPDRLAGIIALSTYLPLRHHLAQEIATANKDLPIFMAHGLTDSVLPLAFAELSHQSLANAGFVVDWHVYPIEHTICYEEIVAISEWVKRVAGT